jgi:hypothetical protein
MADNDIVSEEIVSTDIVSDSTGLCVEGDPTAGNIDPTNPDARTAGIGISKSNASNAGNAGTN